jgi:hypothetical protein
MTGNGIPCSTPMSPDGVMKKPVITAFPINTAKYQNSLDGYTLVRCFTPPYIILDFFDKPLRSRKVKRFIADFKKVQDVILTVKLNELMRCQVMSAHIFIGNVGLQK